MFDRAILHLDLDAFFVSVERLRNAELVGKPLLIGGKSGRGVVASCSYEARRFGVHSAMPMRLALQRCPEAIVLRGDMEAYSKASELVTEVIHSEAPLYEKASIDEFYLDLTGMDRHFGCWQWSRELRQKIRHETGLPLSLGLSVNKLVSKVGTSEAKPDGEQLIEAGLEKDFLAPLSIRKLPSIGKKTYRKLSLMGVRTVRTLAQIPPHLLQREFGKHGLEMWRRANGIDDRPVEPYQEQKSISFEHTFAEDTIDMTRLRNKLTEMVIALAFELRQKERLTACVTVKIRYTDFNTYTRQRRIPYTAMDNQLLQHTMELFEQLFTRRQLIRLVGVRFSSLIPGNYQVQLFEDTEKEIRLLQQLDHIRNRFGEKAVMRASLLESRKRK